MTNYCLGSTFPCIAADSSLTDNWRIKDEAGVKEKTSTRESLSYLSTDV